MKPTKAKSWKALVNDVIDRLPRQFCLADVLEQRDAMAREYPNNRFIDAKIRQTLQILRDQGRVEFLGDGRYRRLDSAPNFSLLIDLAVAATYRSKSQITRVQLETWAELNLYCLGCASDFLEALPPNTPVADLQCRRCNERYQLKGTLGHFSDTVLGAAYKPVVEAIRKGILPSYILIEYVRCYNSVWFVRAIPGHAIDESRVRARKPLAPEARRAGWTGCTINVADLPTVDIVAPRGIDRKQVRKNWAQVRG